MCFHVSSEPSALPVCPKWQCYLSSRHSWQSDGEEWITYVTLANNLLPPPDTWRYELCFTWTTAVQGGQGLAFFDLRKYHNDAYNKFNLIFYSTTFIVQRNNCLIPWGKKKQIIPDTCCICLVSSQWCESCQESWDLLSWFEWLHFSQALVRKWYTGGVGDTFSMYAHAGMRATRW